MTFKAAICPSCGGALQLPDDRSVVKCMYCGVDVIVKEAIHAAAVGNIENWLKLATAAAEANNYREAYDYFTKVLEADGNSCRAWLGKAEAVGRMSTGGQNRLDEMLVGFRHALGCAPPEHRKEIEERIANSLIKATSSYYREMRATLSPGFGNPSTFQQFVSQVMVVLGILEQGYKLVPESKPILQNIVEFCAENLRPIPFTNMYNGLRGNILLPPPQRFTLESQHSYYLSLLAKLDPTWSSSPEIPVASGFQLPQLSTPVWIGVGVAVLLFIGMIASLVDDKKGASRNSLTAQSAATSPTPVSPAEALNRAKQLTGPSASKDQLVEAQRLLQTIPKEAKEYKEAQSLLKQTEAAIKARNQVEDIETNPIQVVSSRWHKGGFDTVAIWTVTFYNRSDKPIGDIKYRTAYYSETGNKVDAGGVDSLISKDTIQKIIPPKQKRTIEVNDGFVNSDASTANFEVVSWRFVK